MSTDPMEADLIAAYKEIESSRETRDSLGEELQEIARMLEHLPANITGPRLVFALGRMVCALPLDTRCQVGREGDELELALPNPAMSRDHFRILQRDARFFLTDTGSRNGTLHNRKQISEAVELEDGDIVQAGGHRFVFLHDGQPDDPLYAKR